ncbi:MAG TPA: EAL domain-containing protein [Sphingomicrobium sp.]|nr:EAL domain-containing protein [Sphingomicrobium sp.]
MREYSSSKRLSRQALANARRDLIVVSTLISAVALLIWNGSSFLRRLSNAEGEFSATLKIAAVAMTLNVALILFGWRRYADIQHEAEKRTEGDQRAQKIASTDGMTGLLNRKGFGDVGSLLAAQAITSDVQVAVLSLQLNRFKSVNDRYGYDVGDAVLRTLAASLEEILPPGAELARLSGAEFAVVIAVSQCDQAMVLGERMLRQVTRPIEEQGKYIQVGAFLGVSLGDADTSSIPDLLRRADIAMEHARSGRVGRPMLFDEGMERELIAHSEIEQGIRAGLDHDRFIPYFEPQVELATGALIGFEVLARWDHPLTGIVSPDRFITIAEEHNLIARLSDQVIRKALAAAVDWDPSLTISINISPRQFTDSWLAQKIVRLLAETGFPAERLIVEVTESSLFADIDLARTIVTSLKNQGIGLALDDFGTGFSSLSHLRALPFDKIKIDRSFVATLGRNRQSAAIIRAVTTLAEAIDVPVTVEGIEDAATFAAVLNIGCEIGQGWYFGKPMSAEDAAHMLRHRRDADQGPTTRVERAVRNA